MLQIFGRNLLLSILLLLLAACAVPAVAPNNDTMPLVGDPQRGASLFSQPLIGEANATGCRNCHSIEEDVVLIGPSLIQIRQQLTRLEQDGLLNAKILTATDYLYQAITQPQAVVNGDYLQLMYARYSDILSEQDIADLIAYIQVTEKVP